MALFFNFSANKPRQYNYIPQYYDERKERLEQQKAKAAASIANGEEPTTSLQKGFLTNRQEQSRWKRSSLQPYSILRFIIITAILVGLIMWGGPALISKLLPV